MSTVMIYAAAFHIFHCFQVFGSICKIKFVMRPTVPSPASAAFTTPLDAHPAFLRAQPESTHMADRPISIARFNLCAEIRRRFFFVFFLFFFFTILENSAFSTLRRNRFFYIVLSYSYSYFSQLFAYSIATGGVPRAKERRRKESKIEWV